MDAAGCGIGDLAAQILARPAFVLSPAKFDVDLVVVSGADLGAPTEPSLADVYALAQAHGLALAPAEVGPQLRLQYLDQPVGEFLRVGMNAIGTRYRPVRAEHATITRFGFEPLATALAVVKVLASISGHTFRRLVSALGQVIVEISTNGVPGGKAQLNRYLR